jgi:hypothetical protein
MAGLALAVAGFLLTRATSLEEEHANIQNEAIQEARRRVDDLMDANRSERERAHTDLETLQSRVQEVRERVMPYVTDAKKAA